MTTRIAPPTAYPMAVQQSLWLSPGRVYVDDLPNFGDSGSNAMAWLFVTLCKEEGERTERDEWVGFAWNALLQAAHHSDNPKLANASMAIHYLRTLYLKEVLVSWQQPSVLYPTQHLLSARH